MHIRYITCPGLRENVPFEQILKLSKLDKRIEFGVQASSSVMMSKTETYIWFSGLLGISQSLAKPLNIALNLNYDWCNNFCDGTPNSDLEYWLSLRSNETKEPLIKRCRVNLHIKTNVFDPHAIKENISNHPEQEFIFPYNDTVKDKINELNSTGAKFSLIYDRYNGITEQSTSWKPPALNNHNHGYYIPMHTDDLNNNLDKISDKVPKNYETWIEAGAGILKPVSKDFDINRAKFFVINSLIWLKNHENKIATTNNSR